GAGVDIESDSSWTAINGSPCTFSNAGTLTKTVTSGVSAFAEASTALAFNNTGVLHVQSGTLDIACGGSGSGSFLVDAGTMLNFGRDSYDLSVASSVAGAGTVSVGGGSASTIAGGVNWGGG